MSNRLRFIRESNGNHYLKIVFEITMQNDGILFSKLLYVLRVVIKK